METMANHGCLDLFAQKTRGIVGDKTASRFPIVLFWPRKTIVHNMSLLTWLNISQAKLLYEILQIRFNGRRFAAVVAQKTSKERTMLAKASAFELGFIMAPTFRQGKSLSNKINTHAVNCK